MKHEINALNEQNHLYCTFDESNSLVIEVKHINLNKNKSVVKMDTLTITTEMFDYLCFCKDYIETFKRSTKNNLFELTFECINGQWNIKVHFNGNSTIDFSDYYSGIEVHEFILSIVDTWLQSVI